MDKINITKKEFIENAPFVLQKAGVKSEKEINALIALTLQLENNHLQEN